MKEKDIINLFDHISPDTLAESDLISGEDLPGQESAGKGALKKARAASRRPGRRGLNLPPWKGLVAAAAVMVIIVASIMTATAPRPALGLASPDYPQGVSYHDFEGMRNKRQDLDQDFLASLSQFAFVSAAEVFSAKDQSNSVYSPLSLFYALALATEGAEGETQAELLRALHMPNIDTVRRESGKLFKHLYTDNEMGKLLLANSLWLQEDVAFNQYFLDKAAEDYYAHSFSVNFTDSDTAKQMSQWVSKHTGGKLGNDPKAFQPGAYQLMSIINTVYFYDQWSNEFNRDLTKKDNFILADGSKVAVPFMNKTSWGSYARGQGFLSTSLGFKNDQQMLLILPDEGVSPYDILTDPEKLAQALTALGPESSDSNYGEVILSMPKFNYTAQLNLREPLAAMGVGLAFGEQADFTGIAGTKPLFISDVLQNLSISVNEKGCEAAAYTQINLAGSGPPQETIEMILNRPFIFAITGGAGDTPLFIGVVNNPAAN